MFLNADGANDPATPLEAIVRHIDYVATRIGIDHVAFGSDFDGAEVPDELGGIAGLPRLVEALRRAGPRRRVAREDHARELAAGAAARRGGRGRATSGSPASTRARR